MQKTVKEIIEMIDNGTLHYDQSTQRNFIYFVSNIYKKLESKNKNLAKKQKEIS